MTSFPEKKLTWVSETRPSMLISQASTITAIAITMIHHSQRTQTSREILGNPTLMLVTIRHFVRLFIGSVPPRSSTEDVLR